MVRFSDPKRDENETSLESPNSSAASATGPSDADDSVNGGANKDRDGKKANKKKRKRRMKDGGISEVNGHGALGKRRNSLSKAARDPRDEPEGKKKRKRNNTTTPKPEGLETRSPSPVIDFDGLSRPSQFFSITTHKRTMR
jgi:GTP cyclohydrolase IA